MSDNTVLLTPAEQEALRGAMLAHFDTCHCTPVLQCAGHRFLQEPNILHRLLWIRRTREAWIAQEYVGTCGRCKDEHQPLDNNQLCSRCQFTDDLGGLRSTPLTLPW